MEFLQDRKFLLNEENGWEHSRQCSTIPGQKLVEYKVEEIEIERHIILLEYGDGFYITVIYPEIQYFDSNGPPAPEG